MAKTVDPTLDFNDWLAALAKPSTLTELAAVGVCMLLAWALVWVVRRARGEIDDSSILFGRRIVDGVLFPLVLLALAYLARAILSRSSISSLMTSWRDGDFPEAAAAISFMRCWISSSVMGEPLATTTTCAVATDGKPTTAVKAAVTIAPASHW